MYDTPLVRGAGDDTVVAPATVNPSTAATGSAGGESAAEVHTVSSAVLSERL